MESTLYETTERAFIDSLGLFSIKKIPFGIKESFPWGKIEIKREKEKKKWIDKKCQTIYSLVYRM